MDIQRPDSTAHKALLQEIRNEYRKIDRDWLMLHYKTSILLVIFASVVELVMGIGLIRSDMLSTTVSRFIFKYMLLPMIANGCCVAIETVVLHARRLTQEQKIYTISLLFVVICFILFTVHSAFVTMYYIFAIAIMLTTIYTIYRLTIITSFLSIAAIVFSELFIAWDTDKISIFESTLRFNNFFISLFVLIGFSIACMVIIRFEQKKNEASIQIEAERQRLQKQLQVDEMTNLYNRKALREAFKNMEDDAAGQYILAIADIDHFKGINDQWGHHVGDSCIITFAQILRSHCASATAFRCGGDEFCLLFRNTQMDGAIEVCRHIQKSLRHLQFEHYPELNLTASFGLAAYSNQMDAVRLFSHSDRALYEAKRTRNAIRVYE